MTEGQAISALPITQAPDRDAIPEAYRLQIRRVHCNCCGTDTESAETYAIQSIRKVSGGGYIRHMIPVAVLIYNLPIERQIVSRREIAFCLSCVETPRLEALITSLPRPLPPVPELVGGARHAPPPLPAGRKPKSSPSDNIDDLLNL
jgi:hypothetical protein